MKRYVTFSNDFHHATARALLRATPGRVAHGMLNASQARRLKRKLCGVAGCTCSENPAGTRGHQPSEEASYVLAGSADYASWYR